MYGKSYDGVTGLIGANKRPAGLKAVVSQEPVYDLYRYLYGDGMRRVNSVATPALYNLIYADAGPAAGRPGLQHQQRHRHCRGPTCHAQNQIAQTGNDDHSSDYWQQRNMITGAKGSNVPLFLTQGLTENNTVADGIAQYLENHTGPEQGWLGPWEHVRGNETDETGRLKMGRAGWFDEIMRFYDRFLKGVAAGGPGPEVGDPDQRRQVARRGQLAAAERRAATPPRCARRATPTTPAAPATGSGAEEGLWTISRPLARRGPPGRLGQGRAGRVARRCPPRRTSSWTSTTWTRAPGR